MSLNNRELLIRKERGGQAGRPEGFRFGSDREIEGRDREIQGDREKFSDIMDNFYFNQSILCVFYRTSNQTVLNQKYRNEK
jgi:hypothetical protein